MKMFTLLLCLLSLAFAEPPVGDGYVASRSNRHHSQHHGSDHLQSNEHGAGLYNAPSQTYLPAARISQEYGIPAARSLSEENKVLRGLSQDYGVPDARKVPSLEYGVPNARSSLSQQYGVPELRSIPSEAYGAPAQRSFGSSSIPTQNKGVSRGSSSRSSQFHSNTVSQRYSTPSAENVDDSQRYSSPRTIFKSSLALRSPFKTYGAPRNTLSQIYGAPASRSLSMSYGAPNTRNSESFSQGGKSVSQSYGPPSQREEADTNEVVSARGQSQDHSTPSHSANLKTDAVASSYAAEGHAIHGASGHDMPAAQYGVPKQYSSSHKDQGYEYARARLAEQLEQEEASYDFAYNVEDYDSESNFGHQETREENKVEGSYFVVLPDGTKQTVEYEADENGFRPRISLERSVVSTRTGYDENAQDLTSSAGPY